MNKNMLEIRDHCAYLSYVLNEIVGDEYDRESRSLVAEWLDIASGIENIVMDTERYKFNLYCSDAYEYDAARDKMLSEIVTQITIFSYVWGALESLIDDISPRQVPHNHGKINAICFFLKENFVSETPIPFYTEILADLLRCIKKAEYYSHFEDRFKLKEFINQCGVGLQVVYKLRNSFAHGSFNFPIAPENWSFSKPIDDEIVNLSIRIVLLSIQMILLAYLKDESINIWPWWEHVLAKEIALDEYLKYLHINKIESNLLY